MLPKRTLPTRADMRQPTLDMRRDEIASRESCGYCQLTVRIATPGFEADLRAFAASTDARTARHAGRALTALASRPAHTT